MNATRLSVRLASAVVMPFAPTILAAFLVLVSQDTQEIPKSTVTTSTNAPMTKESAAARPNAKILQVHSNAHVSMEHPSIPSQNAVEEPWPVPITTNALETPFVTPDPACVPSPTLDPIAKILVTLPLVSPMLNVSYKILSLCVAAYQDSNYCQYNAPVSISMNVARPKLLAVQEPFVKIPWDLLSVSVPRVPLAIPLRVVSVLLPKSADPILSAVPVKLVSLPKENACAEEDTIVIPKLENAKISMSV